MLHRRKVTKELRPLPEISRTLYWGAIARDAASGTIHKPDIFIRLLQAQYQNGVVVPISAPDRVPGKDRPDHPSGNITV